jgi:hypothetical protein
MGDIDRVMQLQKEKEALCRTANNPEQLVLSLMSQATLLVRHFARLGEAYPLVEEAHSIAVENGLVALAQQTKQMRDALQLARQLRPGDSG